MNYSLKDIEQIYKEADDNQDGGISWIEFSEALREDSKNKKMNKTDSKTDKERPQKPSKEVE